MRNTAEAIAATNAAVALSDKSRSEEWKRKADNALTEVARNYERFTATQLREYLGEDFLGFRPHAMGAVFRRGMRDSVIRQTDSYVLSEIPEQHRRPLRVWESLIFNV